MSPLGTAIRRLLGGTEVEGSAERGTADDGAVQAVWNGAVLAESEHTVVVEGNHYFPPEDVDFDNLEPSGRRTVCPWKGVASYHDVVVDGHRNRAAAWYYADPSPAAAEIRDHVAFWHGVEVRRAPAEGT
ncbi:MAG: DUF427 domain-containing protein [Actinobacteria bacterium]|nr:DUF427 domain-containing protein [Actinomycetota bacterium]